MSLFFLAAGAVAFTVRQLDRSGALYVVSGAAPVDVWAGGVLPLECRLAGGAHRPDPS